MVSLPGNASFAAITLVDGNELSPGGGWFTRTSPVTGAPIGEVPRGTASDVAVAVAAARRSWRPWAEETPVRRGAVLRAACRLLENHSDELVSLVRAETGKPLRDARGELDGCVEMGYFVAGEGRRLYGRTMPSAVNHKSVSQIRAALGVAGLIAASNTPLPNYAWKVFPALLCGNAVVLKPSEDTPFSATRFVQLLHEAGVPVGALNLVHGLGGEAGASLVEADVDVLSFTGSAETGRRIAASTGSRLVKTCLELGGKNPLLVCDDADLDGAVDAAVRSAFSNAGQRCAAGSRIIVMDAVYDRFLDAFVAATQRLIVSDADDADLGPLISQRQLRSALAAVDAAREAGARVLTGGEQITAGGLGGGNFLAPTIIEDAPGDSLVTRSELFAPVCSVYRVPDFSAALAMADDTDFGLTAAMWSSSLDRAAMFTSAMQVGMAVVNGPTFGSEPHMPFGGFRQSGNGFREAGTEALDVYSDWRTVSVLADPRRA